jgi:uncharacterized membrane protein YfcA
VTLELVLLICAALGAGTVDAIAGGGGLITLPALMAAGLPPHAALATNKGQSVFGSCAALITFWRAGRITRGWMPWTFALGLLGSFAGAAAVMAVSPANLKPVIIALLVIAAGGLMVRKP